MATKKKVTAPLKLDIGCGANKKEGFTGVDQYKMAGVDIVCDLRKKWPFEDNSVDEVHCSHFIEHLTNLGGAWERVKFFNELHRVLKPGAQATIILPHWASNRFYGDPTHKEPFSEMGFYYLSKEWRKTQAPHTDIALNKDGYSCDLECTWGYGLHPSLATRNQEFQQFAIQYYKEAASDIHATVKKR
jgi:ubiquinone/menaquinone biosynthesis C-methylase UbiE